MTDNKTDNKSEKKVEEKTEEKISSQSQFWQVRIKIPKDRSLAFQEFFLQSGAIGFFELLYQEGVTENLSQEDTWLFFFFEQNFPASAFSVMATNLLLPSFADENFFCELVRYADYLKQFEKTFLSFALTQKTWLFVPWDKQEKPNIEKKHRSFVLKPGMAFGTGKHVTSQLMTSYIETHIQEGDTVFDLGCGSGILSLAALTWGASKAVGVDVENLSVESAKENAALNPSLQKKCFFATGDFSFYDTKFFPEKVDVFLANILAAVFYANAQHLRFYLHNTKRWALSGIVKEKRDEFSQFLRELDVQSFSIAEKEDWLIFFV